MAQLLKISRASAAVGGLEGGVVACVCIDALHRADGRDDRDEPAEDIEALQEQPLARPPGDLLLHNVHLDLRQNKETPKSASMSACIWTSTTRTMIPCLQPCQYGALKTPWIKALTQLVFQSKIQYGLLS